MANSSTPTIVPEGLQDHTPSILFLLIVLFLVYFSNTGRLTKVVAALKGAGSNANGVIQAGPIQIPFPGGGQIVPIGPGQVPFGIDKTGGFKQ